MKNLIILLGTIALGAAVFQMMVGDSPESLKSAAAYAMRQNLRHYEDAGEAGM